MFLITTAVIFVFGLVVAGVVALAVFQSRELAERQVKVDAAERENPVFRAVQ